jgi:hypothetical protein
VRVLRPLSTGGAAGFNKRVFEAQLEETSAGQALVLNYTSPDGEEVRAGGCRACPASWPGPWGLQGAWRASRRSSALRCAAAGPGAPSSLSQLLLRRRWRASSRRLPAAFDLHRRTGARVLKPPPATTCRRLLPAGLPWHAAAGRALRAAC